MARRRRTGARHGGAILSKRLVVRVDIDRSGPGIRRVELLGSDGLHGVDANGTKSGREASAQGHDQAHTGSDGVWLYARVEQDRAPHEREPIVHKRSEALSPQRLERWRAGNPGEPKRFGNGILVETRNFVRNQVAIVAIIIKGRCGPP